MASAQGKASYKKKQGVIAVSEDHTRVTWTPLAGGSAVTLATANITSVFCCALKSALRCIATDINRPSTDAGYSRQGYAQDI